LRATIEGFWRKGNRGAPLAQQSFTAPGDVITTSNQKDNQQWMVAQQDRSMTFDVGVVDLPASYRYAMKAGN
jgi:hypothetical protein